MYCRQPFPYADYGRIVRDSGLLEYRQSALLPPGSYCGTVPSPGVLRNPNCSWTSFVDDVKGCFRGSAETAEASRSDYLANAFFTGLRTQAQRNLL